MKTTSVPYHLSFSDVLYILFLTTLLIGWLPLLITLMPEWSASVAALSSPSPVTLILRSS